MINKLVEVKKSRKENSCALRKGHQVLLRVFCDKLGLGSL